MTIGTDRYMTVHGMAVGTSHVCMFTLMGLKFVGYLAVTGGTSGIHGRAGHLDRRRMGIGMASSAVSQFITVSQSVTGVAFWHNVFIFHLTRMVHVVFLMTLGAIDLVLAAFIADGIVIIQMALAALLCLQRRYLLFIQRRYLGLDLHLRRRCLRRGRRNSYGAFS